MISSGLIRRSPRTGQKTRSNARAFWSAEESSKGRAGTYYYGIQYALICDAAARALRLLFLFASWLYPPFSLFLSLKNESAARRDVRTLPALRTKPEPYIGILLLNMSASKASMLRLTAFPPLPELVLPSYLYSLRPAVRRQLHKLIALCFALAAHSLA